MSLVFHSPAFLWALAALPIVVLLHYMRARRARHDVSALFLWERATVSASRRRRVRPSWLLLLQLLFVAAAALALARPTVVPTAVPDRVIIVDASASLRAAASPADVGAEEPTTRMDLARETATELSQGADRLALIRAGTEPTLMLPLEAPADERAAALQGLAAGDASADLSGALDLAAALLPGAEVHVVTDQQLAIGQASVHVVGEDVPNIGISALEVGIGQVFVGVVASGPQPVQTRVVVTREGEELASSDVLVPAGGTGSVTFPLQDLSGVIEARLVGPPDALPLDDVAYAGSQPVRVVTDDTHGAVTRALEAVPNTEVEYSRGAGFLEADLRVLTFGSEPATPGPYVSFAEPALEPRYAIVRDHDRAHALLRFADLSEMVVGLDPTAEPWPADEEGWHVLARTADLTPVIRVSTEDGPLALQFAFHPSQSDLTLRPAFPALLANVLASLRTTASARLGEATAAGEPRLEPGVYEGGDGGLALASLLSARESRLPREGQLTAATVSAAAPATADEQAAPSPRGALAPAGGAPTTLAIVLCALALLALLAEWTLRRVRLQAR